MLNIFIAQIVVFFITLMVLFLYLKLSHKYHWFDKPDELRKLHDVVRPTAAGLIFMLPVCVFLIWAPTVAQLFNNYTIAMIMLVMILLGAYDDFKPLSAKLRFIIIFTISLYFIYTVFNDKDINLLLLVYLLGLIWWLNLYNFMDGADGMAALHALITVAAYGIMYLHFGFSADITIAYFLLIFLCLLAFLLFNFPKAKLFMGDAGSLSVAFVLAAFAMYGIANDIFGEIFVISLHLVFIVDTTLTLFTRLLFKHKITQAHNLHIYQILIKSGYTHMQVAIFYAIITLIIASLTVFLQTIDLQPVIRIMIVLLETGVLSFFWLNFHKKTKFKHFAK